MQRNRENAPHPGMATGTIIVLPGLSVATLFVPSTMFEASNAFAPFSFNNFKNFSLVAMIPFPLAYPSNDALSFLISSITHLTYSLVSALFILDWCKVAGVNGPLVDNNFFVISRQSRYIMYGSSNLTLKKRQEPGLYGKAVEFEVDGWVAYVRTTNPSTASPFHSPVSAQLSVKSLTS